jgi:hypothetical protein
MCFVTSLTVWLIISDFQYSYIATLSPELPQIEIPYKGLAHNLVYIYHLYCNITMNLSVSPETVNQKLLDFSILPSINEYSSYKG